MLDKAFRESGGLFISLFLSFSALFCFSVIMAYF
jgi:hypothetical protein